MNIKVPVSWLREYLKTDVAAKTIANYLSLSGPSVERIEKHAEDYIFDIEVTSNRTDASSVFGLAREAHAILSFENQKSQLIPPKGLDLNLQPETTNQLPLEVIIKNRTLCPRFTAIVIDNVKIQPSPAFIKNRLQKSGIRPINNVVDISNYIMLELGQPMHTFDYDKILGKIMVLRDSEEAERITTLDGHTRKLPKGTIVIEDTKRLIDLCGIMGGQNSQISRRTKRVLLFVQAYDPLRIRKTTQSLAFRTEAAARFEKGVDLEGIVPALSRAVYLAKKTAQAKIASELTDIVHAKVERKPITLNFKKLNDYLGIEISPQKAPKILELLGFKASSSSQSITATPPSWRLADVQEEVDLIEEIARIYGYHRLPSTLPAGQIPKTAESDFSKVIELKKALKYLGLTEVISYSIISKDLLRLCAVDQKDAVELASPLTSEWQFMRPTILVSLASIIAQNQNLKSDLKFFEVAKTYISAKPPPITERQKLDSRLLASLQSGRGNDSEGGSNLPIQDLKLAIVLQNSDFYQVKGIIENVFEILKREIKFEKVNSLRQLTDRTIGNNLFDKSQSAQIKLGETTVGTLGILSSHISDYFEIENPIAAAEINLTTNYQLPTTSYHYAPVPKYPPVIEDISAIFDEKTGINKIVLELTEAGSPLVKNIDVIDVFRDEKIGKGKKSATLRLTYQKSTATPTQEEVKQIRDKIIDTLSKVFIAILRK